MRPRLAWWTRSRCPGVAVEGEVLPSDAGGSSTPFLVPPVFGRRSDPKGLVPRLVQRTVHSGAHAPARPRVPIPPPLTCDRKVTNRPDGASEPVLTTGTRTARKKIQKNLRSMATKRVTHESYWLYGPARAGRRAIHLPLEAALFFRGSPPPHIAVMCDSSLAPARVSTTKGPVLEMRPFGRVFAATRNHGCGHGPPTPARARTCWPGAQYPRRTRTEAGSP